MIEIGLLWVGFFGIIAISLGRIWINGRCKK